MGMDNPRNLNYVLGSVGMRLEDLGKLWSEEIPPIQALVVRKDSSVPGVGVDPFLDPCWRVIVDLLWMRADHRFASIDHDQAN